MAHGQEMAAKYRVELHGTRSPFRTGETRNAREIDGENGQPLQRANIALGRAARIGIQEKPAPFQVRRSG